MIPISMDIYYYHINRINTLVQSSGSVSALQLEFIVCRAVTLKTVNTEQVSQGAQASSHAERVIPPMSKL